MRRIIIMSVLFIVVLFIAGCAYTTKSTLPENIKTIEVVTFGILHIIMNLRVI